MPTLPKMIVREIFSYIEKGLNKTKKKLRNTFINTPPSKLHLSVAYAHLKHKHSEKDVGTIVGHLYELAKRDGLKAQIEEREWLEKECGTLTKSDYLEKRKDFAQELKTERPDLYNSLYRKRYELDLMSNLKRDPKTKAPLPKSRTLYLQLTNNWIDYLVLDTDRVTINKGIIELYELEEFVITPETLDNLVNVDSNGSDNERFKKAILDDVSDQKGIPREYDDIRKSPFELATISSNIFNKDVEKKILTELQYRVDKNLPLPPDLFKARLKPDYLQNLKKAGLKVKGSPNQVSIDLDNNNPSIREQRFHKIFPWLAFIITLTTAIGAGIAYPFISTGIFAGLAWYMATTSGDQFGFFDKAQDLLRILNWSLSSEFPLIDKFSLRKSLKSSILIASIGFVAASVAMGAFSGIMAFSFLASNTPYLHYLHIGLAGFVAGVSALGTTLGCFVTTNYNFGISFSNNQFDDEITEEIASHLPNLKGKKCLASRAEVDKNRPKRKKKAQYKTENKAKDAQLKEQYETIVSLQTQITELKTRLKTNPESNTSNIDSENAPINKTPGLHAGDTPTQNNDNSASDSDSNIHYISKPKRRGYRRHRKPH